MKKSKRTVSIEHHKLIPEEEMFDKTFDSYGGAGTVSGSGPTNAKQRKWLPLILNKSHPD